MMNPELRNWPTWANSCRPSKGPNVTSREGIWSATFELIRSKPARRTGGAFEGLAANHELANMKYDFLSTRHAISGIGYNVVNRRDRVTRSTGSEAGFAISSADCAGTVAAESWFALGRC